MNNILENIFIDLLKTYLNYEDSVIETLLVSPDLAIKERINKINDLEVLIYSNDHNPPHFHVKSKDLKVDAKFLIDNGQFISGEISSKDLKKIQAFYKSPKTKIIMEAIWNKRL